MTHENTIPADINIPVDLVEILDEAGNPTGQYRIAPVDGATYSDGETPYEGTTVTEDTPDHVVH
jgi:hypothetical protein